MRLLLEPQFLGLEDGAVAPILDLFSGAYEIGIIPSRSNSRKGQNCPGCPVAPLTVEVAVSRVKEIRASRACTVLSQFREAGPPVGVVSSLLGGDHRNEPPGTDAPVPPHTQTQGQRSWVWAPYGLQNCLHPRLMECKAVKVVWVCVCP